MKSNRGFSLLETLLYLGIFAIVGGSLFGILTNVVRISTKEVAGDEVSSQLNFTMTTLNRLVREASNIETSTSTATTTLKLRMADPLKDPTCVILSGGVLKLAEGPDPFQKQNCTSTTTDITTDKVVVDKALFRKAEFPGGHDQILLDLQFSNLATGASKVSRVLRSGISRVSAATFDSDLLPNTDAQYEVGFSGTKRWKNISISNLLNLGTIASDPTGIDGSVYYNSTSKAFRGKANGVWADLGSTLWRATSTSMYSNVTGNVGIGTQTPLAKFEVSGGDTYLSTMSIGQSGGHYQEIGYNIGFTAANDTYTYRMTDTAASIRMGEDGGDITFRTAPSGTAGTALTLTERMKIDVVGNVGIGISNPGVKLAVRGADDAASTGLLELSTTGGTNLKLGGNTTYSWIQSHSSKPLYINQLGNNVVMNLGAGNVGIGTATPAQKLDVSGSIAGTGIIAGASGITLGGVNRTTWPASAPAASGASHTACGGTNGGNLGVCAIAGNGQVWHLLSNGTTGFTNASGVVPTSNVACGDAGSGTLSQCVTSGNGQVWHVLGNGTTGFTNASGVIPSSNNACSGSVGANPGVCATAGNGQVWYLLSNGTTGFINASGVLPTSNVACGRSGTGAISQCIVGGNGQAWYVLGNGTTGFINASGVTSQ